MKKVFSTGVVLGTVISTLWVTGLNAGAMGPIETGHQWTGLYAGGNLGGKWGDFSAPVIIETATVSGAVLGPSVQIYDVNPSSFTGGGQIGYNLQFNHWVVGAEGNINGHDLTASRTLVGAEISPTSQFVAGDTFTTKSDLQASILGRIGYAADNWFFYATGGVGFTNVKFLADFVPAVDGGIATPYVYGSQNHRLTGGTYGLGFEYALTENWRMGVEGRYTDYGRTQYPLNSVPVVALSPTAFVFSPASADMRVTTGEVLFKINYQLT
ncbi:membrane protein [Legionella antarctica]|uniref:Membrane protein n=1 Tax=Legionella antarctica TaxID=2708020 RepID=A0A6F8T6Q0_9GAMM|nr:outer membrane beta-barrel protein [Legionella antarctica]BCA95820.1 membrane protein [Legionella antarctica]